MPPTQLLLTNWPTGTCTRCWWLTTNPAWSIFAPRPGRRCGVLDSAGDVASAAALLQRQHYDLIILDISLPGGRSGTQWLHELRGEGFAGDVVLMTAYADLDTAIDAPARGRGGFLLKPLSLAQLLNAVKRCFERSRLQQETTCCAAKSPPRAGWKGWLASPRRCAWCASGSSALRRRRPPCCCWASPAPARGGGALQSPHEPARRWAVCAGELRGDCRGFDRVRAVWPCQRRVFRRQQQPGRACFTTRAAARCFWMKSANCRWRRRPSCCARWKSAGCGRWA